MLLVVGPASLRFDHFVHLLADRFLDPFFGLLRDSLVRIDQLLGIVGFSDAVVLPLAIKGARHNLRRLSLHSELVLGLELLHVLLCV